MPSRKDRHSPAQKLFGHPHTAAPSRQSGRRAPKKQNNKPPRHWNNQKHSTTYMPAHYLTYALALQSQQTKLWYVYGTVVAIGPHRRYYIKTHSGRVLVHNRRFLRRRIPASLQPLVPVCHPSTPNQHTSPPANSSPPPASPESTIHTCHSLRPRRPPSRLVEDPNWP